MCEEMASQFGGRIYYSDHPEKMTMLKGWTRRPMFATGALGAGVNIDGIMKVFHIGVPYGMIPFIQESGRAGRKREKVTSIIFISEAEMNRCEETDPDDLKVDEVSMRDYVLTEDCRCKVLSEYLNGKEMNCVQIEGELCDNCVHNIEDGSLREKRRREEEERVQAVKRMRMLKERERHVKERVMEVGRRDELVENHLEVCKMMCGTCVVISGWEVGEHKFEDCDELDELVGPEGYESWRRKNIRSARCMLY
jgi:superfamily II DNA helicase RecQ